MQRTTHGNSSRFRFFMPSKVIVDAVATIFPAPLKGNFWQSRSVLSPSLAEVLCLFVALPSQGSTPFVVGTLRFRFNSVSISSNVFLAFLNADSETWTCLPLAVEKPRNSAGTDDDVCFLMKELISSPAPSCCNSHSTSPFPR